jgi:2-keto-4-pentenoate hydratase/2-oxohepta-3-ene-1,7-dioic acid hydratase in catechol pathway
MSRPLTGIALTCCLWALALGSSSTQAQDGGQVTKFVRFQAGKTVAYGILEGDAIHQLAGDLFDGWRKTNKTHNLGDVKLLVPTRPTQVVAMAGNYKSHLDGGSVSPPFQIVQPFFKSPSCLLEHEGAIVLPQAAEDVHFEAEMVIVIGKTAKNVSPDEALNHVFGVTCGNDVSARVWQKNDVQWWRAKGSDTFGPCGPVIATGLDYDNLMMELRVNGEVKQKESTNQLIHGVAGIVSGISQSVTLHPGDLIFTGTPGKTSALQPGDVVEVEIEGVGVLRNPVVAEE